MTMQSKPAQPSRPRVFVTRRIPDVGLSLLNDHCELDVWPGELPPPRETLISKVQGCTGILSLLSDRIDGAIMDAAGPQLRVISNFAVGYNNIDVPEATRRGIAVGNTPGALTDATADLAVTLALAASRRLPESINQVVRHEWRTWEPLGLLGPELTGGVLGILGMGRIGLRTAERLHRGWGMQVIYTARARKSDAEELVSARRVELDELLTTSDVLSIHCDLNESTKHLINRDTLSLMKPTAILVNTSRGGVIDQVALYDALKAGRPWAAALDVTDPEPLPSGHPLYTLPNCMILPHIGSATYTARNAMATIAAENLLAGLRQQPLPHAVR